MSLSSSSLLVVVVTVVRILSLFLSRNLFIYLFPLARIPSFLGSSFSVDSSVSFRGLRTEGLIIRESADDSLPGDDRALLSRPRTTLPRTRDRVLTRLSAGAADSNYGALSRTRDARRRLDVASTALTAVANDDRRGCRRGCSRADDGDDGSSPRVAPRAGCFGGGISRKLVGNICRAVTWWWWSSRGPRALRPFPPDTIWPPSRSVSARLRLAYGK